MEWYILHDVHFRILISIHLEIFQLFHQCSSLAFHYKRLFNCYHPQHRALCDCLDGINDSILDVTVHICVRRRQVEKPNFISFIHLFYAM